MATPRVGKEGLRPIADVDRVIHEPARLMIMALLYVVESGDFTFLMGQTGLTWGNLSSHMRKLEDAGYIEVKKEFRGRKPHTRLRLTSDGRAAFGAYIRDMKQVLDDLTD
jgi:DNA-binding transcriptional ArsR family regulator